MNKVILMGRLTRDPEVRYSAGENALAIARYTFRQGLKIAVTGRIQTGSYTNRDGQKVYTTEVVVEDQEFAESKASSDSYAASHPRTSAPEASMPNPGTAAEGFMNIPDGIDEELPFN